MSKGLFFDSEWRVRAESFPSLEIPDLCCAGRPALPADGASPVVESFDEEGSVSKFIAPTGSGHRLYAEAARGYLRRPRASHSIPIGS